MRRGQIKSEHAGLRGRNDVRESGAKTVARVKMGNEARQPAGNRGFRLEANQAKWTTEGYGGTVTTDEAADIQSNARQR